MSPTKPLKRPLSRTKNDGGQHDQFSFVNDQLKDSDAQGKFAMQWLLGPLSITSFFSEYFEKKPVVFKNKHTYFQELLSIPAVEKLVSSGCLKYGTDLDVTKYHSKSGRKTLNKGHDVKTGKETWDKFARHGCSLRMLRPQQHETALWSLCGALELFLDCMVGANAYLTPADSQGFAPHFDDIDAFICQVEGRKRWRVYAPREDGHDTLPRASSVDFTQEDLKNTEVLIDTVLEPGNMLYLPRGAIHQAECPGDGSNGAASLHVTISAFQKWTWADLLIESFAVAVRSAAAGDKSLRRTLPLRFAEYAGVTKTEKNARHRERLHCGVRKAVKRVAGLYPTDAAADILAERFMEERLPPPPFLLERNHRGAKRRKGITGSITGKTSVRAVGRGVARVVMGDEKHGDGNGLPRLIHCVANTRAGRAVGDAEGEGALACLPEEAFAVDFILDAYPSPIRVQDVPMKNAADRVELVQGLVEMGVLMVE